MCDVHTRVCPLQQQIPDSEPHANSLDINISYIEAHYSFSK